MLELLLCATFTILPDYLYRRYRQGKRFGHEITLYSVWFELRYGIIGCLMLTVALITMIFYYHPSTSSATLYYRTIPIVPEVAGRVAEVHVDVSATVKQGDVIFRLDSAKQEAALLTARRKIAEVDAAMLAAEADIMKAEGQLQEAKGSLQQATDELDTKSELQKRNPGIVPQRDIEKLQVAVAGRQGSLDAATASKQAATTGLSALLPAEKASAEAALAEAQVDLDKTFIRAGVDGRVEQFGLKPGDIVNPMIRTAGVLIPEGAGRRALMAGFGQIEAQQVAAPGTILVFMEPIYKGGLEGVTPGSSCIANAYTSNRELISSGKLGSFKSFGLHVVDATGLVHALLLRIQALVLPIKTLVLSGH